MTEKTFEIEPGQAKVPSKRDLVLRELYELRKEIGQARSTEKLQTYSVGPKN